jgi:hypothetical protein
MHEKRNVCKVLVSTKRPLGRPMSRREDNIKIDVKVRWEDVDWIRMTLDRDHRRAVVNTVMNIEVP